MASLPLFLYTLNALGSQVPALLLVHPSLAALPAAGATKPCGRAHEEGRQEEHPLNMEPSARRVLCME